MEKSIEEIEQDDEDGMLSTILKNHGFEKYTGQLKQHSITKKNMHKLSGAHLKELGVNSIGDRLELLDIFQEELGKSKAEFEHISVPVELIVKFKKVKDGENEHQVVFTVSIVQRRFSVPLDEYNKDGTQVMCDVSQPFGYTINGKTITVRMDRQGPIHESGSVIGSGQDASQVIGHYSKSRIDPFVRIFQRPLLNLSASLERW